MHHAPPESDWKAFRKLREVTIQRFCQRVFDELEQLRENGAKTSYERYLDVHRLLQTRDEELGIAFDNPRRSQMMVQLAAIYAHELLEPEEFARFSTFTRQAVELFAETVGWLLEPARSTE